MKAMTNLNGVFKSRDTALPPNVCLVKAMVFPVVVYGCESWTIKKAERWRIDAFELWCWRRLLRVPWTARRSNQSILKEIGPGISLEGLMLKLKLQYFGHLMWRANSLEKTLMLGKLEGKRRREQQRLEWLNSITDSPESSRNKERGWCFHNQKACKRILKNWDSDLWEKGIAFLVLIPLNGMHYSGSEWKKDNQLLLESTIATREKSWCWKDGNRWTRRVFLSFPLAWQPHSDAH